MPMQIHSLCILILLTLGFSPNLSAQLSSGSAYLQGEFLEVGIAPCGAYGTPNSPPPVGAAGSAYHNTEPGIGFVADADMDGWAVGVPPYSGDYFLPGSPVEGYTMSIDGINYSNSSGFGICGAEDIPGSITDYSFGDTLSATWSGTHTDGFDMSIRTWFPRNKRYFIGTVTLTNTSASVKNEIYFSRQVDPDNDQAWGGGFPTDNTIVSQPTPANPDALVTAIGGLGSFLGIGARHFASRVARGGFFIMGPEEPFCGVSPYELEGSITSDDAIGVSFYFAKLDAGQSITFSYAYVLDEDELEEALEATNAPVIVADGLTLELSEAGVPALEVCEGDSVLIEIQGGENYNWTWTPASAFTEVSGISVWFKPNGTGVYTVSSDLPCGDPIEYVFEAGIAQAGALAIADTAVCPGAIINLNDSEVLEGITLNWSVNDWFTDTDSWNPIAVVDTEDVVIHIPVEIRDNNGCSFYDSARVEVRPTPAVYAGADIRALIGETVTLSGSGVISYNWSSSSMFSGAQGPNPTYFVTDTSTFTLHGIDRNGCSGTDDVTVYALPSPIIGIPNAFTPNADGLNDCFKINIGNTSNFIDIRIFSRWGGAVFVSVDPNSCWDGTLAGKAQEMGSYVVVVRYIDEFNKEINRSGTLTLLR
jgi:gliding motility-associated-like protein